MIGTRYEEYGLLTDGLPFVFNTNLKRTNLNCSKENNWHDNLEIQLCTEGSGYVLLDGKRIPFNENDIVVINSNVIHYTYTETALTYSCLIVSTDFCKKVGLDPQVYIFSPFIKSAVLVDLLNNLKEIYSDPTISCYIAKLNEIVLKILIELAEHHIVEKNISASENKNFETVKSTISYIRKNYDRKITLDEISKAVLCDKYALCREFKKLTGQTIIENINNYRCIKAIDCLNAGYTVAQTAALCGFENLSFFTKTFKKQIGRLPSCYK